MSIILWFRRDLRIMDNPALNAAIEKGEDVIPLFIHSPEEEPDWPMGGASKWWLHHSLLALNAQLEDVGSRLIVRAGDPQVVLNEVLNETRARSIYWNRRYEPGIRARDSQIKEQLKNAGHEPQSFKGNLLFEPWEGCKADKTPYLVYTPFAKNLKSKGLPSSPIESPRTIPAPKKWPVSLTISALALLPKLPWAEQFEKIWKPGVVGATTNLKSFLSEAAARYEEGRNLPAKKGTSALSPHLHFGEVTPQQIVAAVLKEYPGKKCPRSVEIYLNEILWREFAYHLLYHFPTTPTVPLRKEFERFPWTKNKVHLKRWQRGETGYPIVDAGMRELWATGWMHNRVRMIVASFLVKDLLIPWQDGARWFWDTLLDADLASNTLGWQWTAGCGADAAPYFRVFNPTLQGEKFDPEGTYVKKWVPEISKLPKRWIHKPWEAPDTVLKAAHISLGNSYPRPIVDHGEARAEALAAYDELKS